jgi:hypothetical protein
MTNLLNKIIPSNLLPLNKVFKLFLNFYKAKPRGKVLKASNHRPNNHDREFLLFNKLLNRNLSPILFTFKNLSNHLFNDFMKYF